MEYRVIRSHESIKVFEEIVNNHINEGWEPLGGFQIDCAWKHQAMIRRDYEELNS